MDFGGGGGERMISYIKFLTLERQKLYKKPTSSRNSLTNHMIEVHIFLIKVLNS